MNVPKIEVWGMEINLFDRFTKDYFDNLYAAVHDFIFDT